MAGEHVRAGDVGGGQQGVEVGHRVLRGVGLGDGVAAAALRRVIDIDADRSRSVVGTDTGEAGDGGQDVRLREPRHVEAPDVAGVAIAGHQHHRGGALTLTLEVHLAAAPDVHEAGEVRWRVRAPVRGISAARSCGDGCDR